MGYNSTGHAIAALVSVVAAACLATYVVGPPDGPIGFFAALLWLLLWFAGCVVGAFVTGWIWDR